MKIGIVLLALVLSAPVRPVSMGSAQQLQRSGVSAAGTYDLQFEHEGQAQASVLTITRATDESLHGTLTLHEQQMTLDSVSVKDGTITASLRMGHGALTLSISILNGDKIAGTWSSTAMGSGKLSGLRRKG